MPCVSGLMQASLSSSAGVYSPGESPHVAVELEGSGFMVVMWGTSDAICLSSWLWQPGIFLTFIGLGWLGCFCWFGFLVVWFCFIFVLFLVWFFFFDTVVVF